MSRTQECGEEMIDIVFEKLNSIQNKLSSLRWKIIQKDIKIEELEKWKTTRKTMIINGLEKDIKNLTDRKNYLFARVRQEEKKNEELKSEIERLKWQNERLRYEYMNEGVDVNDGWGVHHIADIPYGEVGLDGKIIAGCDRITDEDEKKHLCSI